MQGDAGRSQGTIKDSILYYTCCNGMELFFTSTGIIYRQGQTPKRNIEDEDDGDNVVKTVPKVNYHFFSAQWTNAKAEVQVIPEDEAAFYHCYNTGGHNNLAHEFKKLLYKNIYPGIDVEYAFRPDTTGLEYSIIVHPGANLNGVKLTYSGIEGLTQSKNGDIEINASFVKLKDHAPQKTFYAETNMSIQSKFILNGNQIAFSAGNYDNTKTLVIDPWQTNVVPQNLIVLYDVCTDFAGNVYVYGLDTLTNHFSLAKFNNAGTFLWSRSAFSSLSSNYGDFTVDKNSGSCFIADGLNGNSSQPVLLKITTSGILVDSIVTTGIIINGQPDYMSEIWRLAYSSCTGKIVIGGGGVQGIEQAATIDTTMGNCTEINVLRTLNPKHDVTALCVDKATANCYMAFMLGNLSDTTYNNVLLKCPLTFPNPFYPYVYMVPDKFRIKERESNSYNPSCNGINGIAASSRKLYMWDGYILREFDKNSGILLKEDTIATPVYNVDGSAQVNWSGIAADACNNVYIGYQDTIINLDTNLARVNSFPFAATNETIYDMQMGPNGNLLVCGTHYVASFSINPVSYGLGKIRSPACSGCTGTALVYLNCNNSNASATYEWSNGSTEQFVTGLCAGTYTVSVKIDCETIIQDTVNITANPNPSVNLPQADVVDVNCYGYTDGSAVATASGGKPPYTYQWFPQNSSGPSINNLAAGTYAVMVTDTNGCSGINNVTITQPDSIVINVPPYITAYKGQNITINASASGGTPIYTYMWNDSLKSSTISFNAPTDGLYTYTVSVTDANGCTAYAVVTVDVECAGLFIPTAFSPNEDGYNDELCVRGDCFTNFNFMVFDRWGNKVFETENIDNCWDGTYKGQPMNTGTYVYLLTATEKNGANIKKKGNVTLVR